MKKARYLFGILVWFAVIHHAVAEQARFFRISGPTLAKIIAFRSDGTLVWSNGTIGVAYTIQTATSLAGGSNWVDYVQIPVTNNINTNQVVDFHPPPGMALIPAGYFQMGDNLDGEFDASVYPVIVSAFYMDKTDVPYSLWQQVYSWAITNGYTFDNPGVGKASNHPVQNIDWYDCVKWCNARSQKEGRTPAYYTTAAQTVVYRSGDLAISNSCVKWGAGYRLPTEAEWEKAARGGLSGQRFPWGNTISWSQANYYGDPSTLDPLSGFAYDLSTLIDEDPAFSDGDNQATNPHTSPVGFFQPNGYGLYDMAGDVSQWCWDYYALYPAGLQFDPRGPTNINLRMFRGGSWINTAYNCRSAFRGQEDPTGFSAFNIGFRCVLSPGQ